MWTIFKAFTEFVTIQLLIYVLFFWPQGMWDLSSQHRDQPRTPCTGRWSLSLQTTREVLVCLLISFTLCKAAAIWQCLRLVSLVAQLAKNLPAVQETLLDSWVLKIPCRTKWQPTPVFLPRELDRGVWRATVHGVARVRHDLATKPPNHHHHHGWFTG